MTKKFTLSLRFVTVLFLACLSASSQNRLKYLSYVFPADSLQGFDEISADQQALQGGFFGREYKVFMYSARRNFINTKYNYTPAPSSSSPYGLNAKGSPVAPLNAPCVNEDFESSPSTTSTSGTGSVGSSLTGWTVNQGQNSGINGSCTLAGCCTTVGSTNAWVRSTPWTAPAPLGTVPNSPLGGTKVLQMNDAIATAGEIVQIQQTFPVTSSNALFQVAYMAAMDGSGHACCDQPFMKISMLNCSNAPLACPSISITPPGSSCVSSVPSGWVTNTSGVSYTSAWQVHSLDLTPYIGSCVTIKIIVGDCDGWAHYGYAFIDCLCSPMNIVVNGNSFPAGTPVVFASACGASSGTITAPPGLGPYTWNGPGGSGINNNPNQTITSSVSGNYTLTMNPPGSCAPITKTVNLTFQPNPIATFSAANSCTTYTFTNTGTGSPAVQTYSFVGPGAPGSFTTTSTTTVVSFPPSTTFTVYHSVVNSATCTTTNSMVITVPTGPNPAFTGPGTQCLNGNTFTFNASTATGTHTYNFNPAAGAPATGNTANYGPVSFTSPGTYTVTHTVTNAGCTSSTSSVITINPMPSATTTQTNATCGLSNGQINISNTSGAGQTVTGFTFDGAAIGSQTIINVAAGVHTIVETNNFGCKTTYTVNITNTPPITALATTFTNATCGASNGSISFGAVTGGTPTYSFSVNGGPFSTSTSTTALPAGTYTITVKDASGCTFTKTVVISNTSGPTALSFTTAPSICGGPGSATIGVTGGTPAYSYSINGAAAGATNAGLAAGTYTALVKDVNGCTVTATFNIANQPGITAASVTVTNATCGNANGSATVTSVTGGTAPYQYSWNGGAFGGTNNTGGMAAGPKNVVIKDVNGCTYTVNFTISNGGAPVATIPVTTSVSCFGGATGSFTVNTVGGTPGYNYTLTPGGTTNTLGIFNGLTAQAYTVTVKDAAGCVTTVTTTVNQPPVLTLTLTPQNVSCNAGSNGTVTAAGGGGVSPYQFSLNGGPFSGTSSFTGLVAGTYTVTIKDANGCTQNQTATITQPPALAISFTTAPNSCVGSAGSVTIGVTGGTPAYTYSIDAVAGGSTATGLSTGTHTALVKDSKGCTITGTFNIGVVTGPTSATISTSNATCGSANGSATVTAVSGGVAPYQYSFNGGAFSLSNNVGSLSAGTQTVVVKDANGCTYTVNFNINNTGSPVSNISASVNVSCNGGNTGSFTVTTAGGTPGYNYTLSPGGTTNTTGIFTGLTAQPYNVTVKDAVGCITTVSITITQPPALSLTLTPTAVSCNAGANGSVTASASGGASPYQYSLNGGPFGAGPFTALTAGTYTVTVKDNNNCTLSQTVTITQPPALAITFTTAPNTCAGAAGSVTIGVTGGTPAYSFSIDAAAGTNTATGLASGTHTALVKDSKGCTITGTFNIGLITGPTSATVNTTNTNCGNANGSATLTGVTGGTGPYQYSWNGGPFSSTNIQTGLTAGTKTVTILDANGCTLTINYIVNNTGGPITSVSTLSNVGCFGGSTGSFTLNTTGGTPGYAYTIAPTNVTSGTGIFTSLTAQSYTVTVKDVAGCVSTITTSISQPTALSLSITPFAASCNASATGSVTAAGSGGSGPYQYSLNGGLFQSGTTFTGVAAGVYNVTVKDNNGCSLTQSVSVSQPSAITLSFTTNNSKCTAANGTASVTATGGTPAYSYTWTGGGGNSALTNSLVAGTYTVTVKDANGCTQTGVATINATPGGTAIITSTNNVTCYGYANGSLQAGTTGAMTAPLSYSWSNGQTTSQATGLGPGAYSCTITDVFGCKSSVTGNITEPGLIDFAVSSTSVSCFGGNNGTGTATYIAGGTPPFTYLWAAGGATTSTAPNLPAGNYTCTMTDANSCTASHTVQVTQPTSVTLSSTVTTANCNQANGSATVSASGGTPAYSYTWSTSTTGPVLSGAFAGTYTITVKDANNCQYTLAATVPNAAGPGIAITSFSNVSCTGGNNGVATATATGGTAPYIYSWSNGQNTGTATNLIAGVYTATVTDQMGCKASVSVTISQPSVLTVSATGTNPKCFGALNGTANAGVLGGSPGYSYTWTPSGGNGPSASGLGAGNYIVTVTDANGCIASSSVALTNPAQMLASIASTNVSCFNACNGSAVGSASNTVGAITWYWTGGPGPLTTQAINGLCAGTYTLQATDQNNCTATASVLITQPTQLTASITASQNPSCATYTNGFATVTPGGGTPGYSYLWSGSSSTLATASNLGAGGYTVTVTDAKGCSAQANITLTQPAALQATLTTQNVTCNGLNNGVGNLAYSGGTGPYTFLWLPSLNNTSSVNNLPPGTHTVQITDNLGCVTTKTATITQPAALVANITSTNSNCGQNNGSACASVTGGTGTLSYLWSSNPTFTNSCINAVVAGPYTVTVTDANGCQVSGIAIINDISGPSVSITATTAVSCFGGSNGSATSSISGGTAPISILWSYLAQTTPNVTNLPAGLHSITVKDAANCVASASVLITQPPQLNSAITSFSNVTCNGANNGTATMLVTGGTPGYSYTWTPGSQSSSVAVSMGPGTYTCFVSDANGCPTNKTVTITQPNPLVINSFSVTDVACNGNNTGQISTNITGGTPAYTYVWAPTQPANPTITNLPAGSYTLTVTDTKSCSTQGSYIVNQPSAMISSATASPATCGNANGSATVTVNGGTPGYNYSWNTPPPQSTQIATGMSANTWQCTITDSKGCTRTQTVAVPNAPGPNITAMTFTAPLCFGQINGSMAMTFTSGTAPFSYQWNNPGLSTTQTVAGIGAGVYSATVTDAYGCSASGVVNVTQPNQLLLNVSPNTTICYGQVAQIYGAGSGGTQPYSYSWTPSTFTGGGPHAITPTITTQYTVDLTDNNGCATSPQIITVAVRPPLQATGFAVTKCDGKYVTLTPNISSVNNGNGGPYTFNWSNGATTPNITVQANYATNPNTYSVAIDDGCTIPNAVANFTVNVNPTPTGHFAADVTSGCAPLAVNFTAVSSSTTDVYMWDLGNDQLVHGNPVGTVYSNVGSYNVNLTIINQYGCKKDTGIANYINTYGAPTAAFSANPWSATILDPGVHFNNESVNATTYFWDFGDYNSPSNNSTAISPDHNYTYAGQYVVYLVAISDKGCTDTASHTVEITPDYAIYIPNAFTPDGNGKNDIFQPVGVGIDVNSYRMYIFDRWGEIIYTSDNFEKGWDGSVKGSGSGLAEEGVYVYKIYVKDIAGNQHYYVGHVTCLPRESKIK